MVGKTVALALAAAALLSAAPSYSPTGSVQYPDVRVSQPTVPTPRPMAQTQTAARNELDRVDEATAIPPRFYRRASWDGKNRTSGDRAHKRMKHRRSSGRR